MAAAALVAVLSAAAEAYAKQLAATLGTGIVETLFHQDGIFKDLEDIKAQIAALSDFVRNQLPPLVGQIVDLELKKQTEGKIVEKAVTIAGRIGTLENALKAHLPEAQIDTFVTELVGHTDAILEMGGELLSGGQAFYASVSIAFGASLKGYAAIAKVAPLRVGEYKRRMESWKVRLQPWLNSAVATSLTGYQAYLNGRQELGKKVVPTVQSWLVGHERRFAISWFDSPGGPGFAFDNTFPPPPVIPPAVIVYGGWFALYPPVTAPTSNADELGQRLPEGVTFDQAVANGTLAFTIPEWWTVKENVPASRADYDQSIADLQAVISDYNRYPAVIVPVNHAIDLTVSAVKQIDRLINGTMDVATALPSEKFIDGDTPFISAIRRD